MNQYARPPQDEIVPMEMRHLLHALSDDKSVEIVARLLRNGKMRFGEIKGIFGLSSSSLSSKLKKMQNGGLVVNFYAKGDDLGHSYYDATEISELVFDSLYNIMYAPNAPLQRQDAAANYLSKYHTSKANVQDPDNIHNDYVHDEIRDNAQNPQTLERPACLLGADSLQYEASESESPGRPLERYGE